MLQRATRTTGFLTTGVIAGVALVFLTRACINETPVADWIVSPLVKTDSPQPSDAIVVLGAGVLAGCVPNENATRRVLLAARMWREGKAPVVIFTGGTGENCTIATTMATQAQEVGVPADAIRVEPVSTNTWENGALVAPLLREWGVHRVLLVTDRLHMPRAAAVFAGLGFLVSTAAVPIAEGHHDNISMLHAGLREFAAIAYYRWRGWLGPADQPSSAPALELPLKDTTVKHGPIVLLGASYAQGWPIDAIGGAPVLNRGMAGQQSFELLARFDQDVLALDPRAVIVWGFINDIFRAPPSDVAPALQRIRESYIEIIGRARRHGIEPILATEVTTAPRTGTLTERVANIIGTLRGKQSYQDRINSYVLDINRWMEETAAREGVLILRFHSVLAEPSGRRRAKFAQPDGSHITKAGYDMLTAYATPILEKFVVSR